MKKHNIAELNQLYKESEQCDSEVFAEQRSNILLVTGNHYNKKNSTFWNRVRESRTLTNEQKLRLTKNHIYRISKIRKNLILTHAPGVQILPAMEQDSQSQKSAELNQSVWQHAKIQQDMNTKTQQFASDFFDIGECCAKIWWNPAGGAFKGYQQATNEMGEALFNEDMTPAPDEENPVFEGQLEIERFFAFNLLRAPEAKTISESPYLTYRKMAEVKDLKAIIEASELAQEEKEEKLSMLNEGKDETYLIFDANKQNYHSAKGITTVKETYFRPCHQYPMGYFYIFVEGGILFEGELPFGIFPIIYEGHDETPTSARHRSPIKQLRPNQIEINRAASSQAEVQITMGQDKLIMQSGAKLTPGEVLPGVRAYHTTGRDPTVLAGRTGEQWASYISDNISELYQIAMIPEEMEEKENSDPWAELFKGMKQKKKFVMDAGKFEGFLTRLCSTYLDLARHYLPDDALIPMIGKTEIVNISEFRNTDKLSYRIKAEPMGDDIHSVMGKTLMINHVLQYASGNIEKEDIGKLIRLMPFANGEKSFEDLTLDYDRAENIILELDRGGAPQALSNDKGPYIIRKLAARTSKADFPFLHQQIQQNYKNLIQVYEQMEADKARSIKAMEADFIPTDGPMIKVAWYIQDPSNPSRSVQATLPANSIQWLVQRLTDQQGLVTQNKDLTKGTQAEVADLYNKGNPQPQFPTGQAPIGMPTNRGMLQ